MIHQKSLFFNIFYFAKNNFFCKNILTNKRVYDIIFKHEGNAPLAQPVEHMTFNHGVRSSILRWSTRPRFARASVFSFIFFEIFHYFSKKLLTNRQYCGIISKYDELAPLAQPVEHMTFNHGVRSSILRWSTRPRFVGASVFSFSFIFYFINFIL